MSGFFITVNVHSLDDAIDIYGRVLSSNCSEPAVAGLTHHFENHIKILSKDQLSKQGNR